MTTVTVLIIEDSPAYQQPWQCAVATTTGGSATILAATTLIEARQLASEHAAQLDLVVLDGLVPQDAAASAAFAPHIKTMPLIEELRERNFTGRIIAASTDRNFRTQMVRRDPLNLTEDPGGKGFVVGAIIEALRQIATEAHPKG